MKKGFTLVELLAVIVLLGIVTLIAFPLVNDSVDLAKEEAYNQTVNSIEEAAKRYGTINMLGYSTEEQILTLETLISSGMLKESDLVNPKTDKKMTGCVYYKWLEEEKMYDYTYDPNC